MRDPLEWRGGDGPLLDWLTWVQEQLIGPQPDGWTLWGARTEVDVYGLPIGSGLSLPEVARRLTELGADALHVHTHAGPGHGEPRLEIAPIHRFDAPGRPFEFVVPQGAPAGRVPLYGTVRTPTELAAWLAAWSPLLPGGVPEAGWSPRSYTEPMAVAFQHRLDSSQLLLTPLAWAERGGNVSIRMLLESARAELGRDLLLLRTPRVLEEIRPAGRGEVRRWLDGIGRVWRADPQPPLDADGPVTAEPTIGIPRILHGAPEVLLRRRGLPMLVVTGPAADLGRWGALLHDPAVLGAAPAGSRRRTERWLEQVEAATWGRPAVWSVDGEPAPLTTPELAARIAGHSPRGDLHLTRVGPAGATLGGVETAGGHLKITGR
ncbi:hypothetical protein ACGFX4_31540 [Kitasatospora sp. NPDC048365]|uniref:hypothetical protein n=1 Tax=Kitasatospora sp. NPDC048365 TaxID=3364050 RepID=UPI0037181C40